jgi:hypothetical protein
VKIEFPLQWANDHIHACGSIFNERWKHLTHLKLGGMERSLVVTPFFPLKRISDPWEVWREPLVWRGIGQKKRLKSLQTEFVLRAPLLKQDHRESSKLLLERCHLFLQLGQFVFPIRIIVQGYGRLHSQDIPAERV